MLAPPADSPLELLRELLADDRRAGIPWQPEQFAWTVHVACRETRCRSWVWPIISTYTAWHDAYVGRPGAISLWANPAVLLDGI